jgi:hypothetical protein
MCSTSLLYITNSIILEIKQHNKNNLEYYTFNNFFTQDEQDELLKVFNYLRPYLDSQEETGAGKLNDGSSATSKTGYFFDKLVPPPEAGYGFKSKVWDVLKEISTRSNKSSIYSICHNVWNFYTNELKQEGFIDSNLLMSYYNKDGDHYHFHTDACFLTFVYWIHNGDTNFSGGELELQDLEHTIKPLHNTAILFPGNIPHRVLPIKMIDSNKDSGRLTFTMFIGSKPCK